MCFTRAIPRVSLLVISIKLAMFDLFWLHAGHFDHYFDHFNLFQSVRSILIHFDSGIEIAKIFQLHTGHFNLFRYKNKIAKIKPVRHPAHYPHSRMCASHLWFLHLPTMSLSVIFFQRCYWRLWPKLFCHFLHKSRRDGTAGRLVFCHVHIKTRNHNFSRPKNTKIKFASSRIDWSGDAGWLHIGMRSLSLIVWPVNPARSKLNFMIRDRDPYIFMQKVQHLAKHHERLIVLQK
jgi:hypothetical protein